MRISIIAVCFTTLLALTTATPAQDRKTAWAVPTFECLSLYYPSPPDRGECAVEYRCANDPSWRTGLPLVYDALDRQYRGSLVGLKPDTEYTIRLRCADQTHQFTARTRSEQFPIGKTTHLPAGELGKPIRITESGTPDAWHLVTCPPGAKTIIDVFNLHNTCVEVAADYVIIRGLELKNATQHALLIRKGIQNVIVEDCHMTGWGRVGGARVWGISHGSDSAIYAESGAGNLILQRNLIDHPRSGSNDWESGHPDGPQGITLINSSGGNIIRYNDIRSTEDHGYNDGIGGASNFSFEGSPNRDSDIYGNIITHCWDDAIEAEGANMNVRIWSNYIDKTFVFIATASTSKGPVYIYRNVFASSRISHQDPSGGMVFKTGGSRTITLDGKELPADHGRRFIFHNTVLQPHGALNIFSGRVSNAITRNNIFRVRGQIYPSRGGDGPPNDFKNDITTSYIAAGLVKSMFLPSDRLEWFLSPTITTIEWGRVELDRGGKKVFITDPAIQVPNPALDKGAPIPGFNDNHHAAAPDIGAFETGHPPLRFGREGAAGFTRAPWETH